MDALKPLIAGNWKMNGLKTAVAEFEAIAAGHDGTQADAVICPPATLINHLAWKGHGKPVAIGGQDCHAEASGAFTGDISAEMLKDAGASLVIVGHSERRQYHAETDATVRAKAVAARRAGLMPIICVGETKDERVAGRALAVVTAQVDASVPEDAGSDLVVAYEPVWAIGTGLTPTNADIAEVHAAIRARLVARFGAAGQGIRILYGGSVKPANAAEILALPDVNGALVGGASLKASDFLGILAACA